VATEYSVEICKQLQEKFRSADLHRPIRVVHYDPGAELVYQVQAVSQPISAKVRLIIEKFVGGGYAGQVYRAKVIEIEGDDGSIEELRAGGIYGMKILVPPTGFARFFRNFLYWVGFQGPFQPQVNPAAAKAGALWQKLIRRGAKIRFGDENMVSDIYATFVDENIGSCGELREWVDGRTWRLEVDDRMDLLKRRRRSKTINEQQLGSPEYRAKYEFMHEFVELLHDMGAYEFARQYEWSTCKSQPNCLKRYTTETDPSSGLVAVDFRAGLTLLPFLPMSPGDFILILKGIARGSFVQFDRGSLSKLQSFIQAHEGDFTDMQHALEELVSTEQVYRNSIPDITHNHVRLLSSQRLWSTILESAVTGWRVRNLIDEAHEQKLRSSKLLTLFFCIVRLIPFLGKFILRIWGQADWRRHYIQILASWGYFLRAVQGKIAEKVISWHRAGRVDAQRAIKIADKFQWFLCHLPLSVLPAGLHRFLSDWAFFKNKLHHLFIRPVKLYFSAGLREEWLRDMVRDGKKKHLLTDQDAEAILSQLNEPYIQRYLVSLVVHLLTLPLTQIVSVILAWIYYRRTGDKLGAGGILVLFQVTPISPGSIARGLYAVGIMIYDRSFKDYNIAVFLSFFKYIGYLAFPIQMTYRYPALARFMAAHWATEAVHIVPVFGERGALLEHWVFCLFYNWPLTIRRRMRKRSQIRASMKPRYWHAALCAIAVAGIFEFADFAYIRTTGMLPGLKEIWWLVVVIPLVCGGIVTLGCGGAAFGRRIIAASICGMFAGLLYAVVSVKLGYFSSVANANIAADFAWRIFIFAILSAVGAILTELNLPYPNET
jgi:hypothetical protein